MSEGEAKKTIGVDGQSLSEEIDRHKVGLERYNLIDRIVKGEIDKNDGMNLLGLSKSYFYKLLKAHHSSLNYTNFVPDKRGRKVGSDNLDDRVESLIEEAFNEVYFGYSASYAKVWSVCQSRADERKIVRPSYHTVRRRIIAKEPKLLFERKFGKEAANQKYGARPGHKKTSRPLEWVQIDHTVVDLLLVDENDRTRIIGRPWISMAICIDTRVVLGFYLSLLPPSAVSVAMLIDNCVMPKEELLRSLGLDSGLWPMHGVMENLHTDNAKEFISDILVLNCKEYGIDVKHRVIGKKHQGGHIESLIGKFMTTKVHFLRGTTGSNVIARKAYKSEARAMMTFSALRKFMIYQVCVYHETKHSAIEKTPAEAWSEYFRNGVLPKTIAEGDQDGFRFRFYPEIPRKQIVPEGIELFRRFYYSPILKNHVRERVLVKYDPYDLDVIRIRLNEEWHIIPCVRNSFNKASSYEIYRHQRSLRSDRNGTMTKLGGQALISSDAVVKGEIIATATSKRTKKKKGVEQHLAYGQMIDRAATKPGNNNSIGGKGGSQRLESHKVQQISNGVTMSSFMNALKSQSKVDYDEDPFLY